MATAKGAGKAKPPVAARSTKPPVAARSTKPPVVAVGRAVPSPSAGKPSRVGGLAAAKTARATPAVRPVPSSPAPASAPPAKRASAKQSAPKSSTAKASTAKPSTAKTSTASPSAQPDPASSPFAQAFAQLPFAPSSFALPGGRPPDLPDARISPERLAELQAEYAERWQTLLSSAGHQSAPTLDDRRFGHESWHGNNPFSWTAALYLLNAEFLQKMADSVQSDDRTRERIRFATQQWVD
ncbi:MAG: hypothetical protein NTV19_19670, partial [Burkholderiales bacterium]|nr:hypothetical protein [Burkholderiales bacterium]